MKIRDGFEMDDPASGLRLKIIKGVSLDRLHVEIIGDPVVKNRDFFFTREGKFDGTGSAVEECGVHKSASQPVSEHAVE